MLARNAVFVRRFGSQLVYERHGGPLEVIREKTQDPELPLSDNHVRVRIHAAPVNPADINQIQGVYPVKPPLPAVGGNEGFGVVEAVGPAVQSLAVGDHVIPAFSGFGTWRSLATTTENALFKIDQRIPVNFAATLQVNPCTAYRMLEDFVHLPKGATVVQNGANSAVGRYVIQIAKQRGFETVNVVRDRANIDDLKAELFQLGATHVYTEEEFVKVVRSIKSELALNCVGGRSSLMISRCLQDEGIMVTYGGMSKQPVQGPTGSFIFNDVAFRGFWMSKWYEKSSKCVELQHKRDVMYKELADWIEKGAFAEPKLVKRKPSEFKEALHDAMASADAKQLFVFNE